MNTRIRSRRSPAGIVLLLLCVMTLGEAAAGSVEVPISLDYPLLRHLMQTQLFNTADRSREILNDPAACSRIYLFDPQLQEYRGRLQFISRVKADIGGGILGSCARLFSWEGEVRFLGEPVIKPDGRSLRVNVLETQLYNTQRQLISSGPLWELANGRLQTLLSQYEIDLNPSLNELGGLLPDVLNRHSRQQIEIMIASLRLTDLAVSSEGIDLALTLQVDRPPPSAQAVAVFSRRELQQLEEKWQTMDVMITYAVKRYAAMTQLPDLRDVLLEILLDSRYRLRDALALPISRTEDPVRHWFLDSWQRLGPVLRRISLEQPSQNPMLLISLLTAADALDALDKLGPAFGLDISSDGLRRLGRLLIGTPGADPLRYDEGVDPELRRLFQLPPSTEPPPSAGMRFDLWPIASAQAGSQSDRLKLWVPEKHELKSYLPLVQALLEDKAQELSKDKRIDKSIVQLYRDLVLATAWQESCWRQYVVEKQKIVPLRSNTGDTGLMQLNERVWRGFYDAQELRWDVHYNARSGAEVLLHYLLKYALKREEHKHPGGLHNLARAAYSAYNSGPAKVSRYRDPKANASHKAVDAAFWRKYQEVKKGQALKVAQCHGLDVDSLNKAGLPAARKKSAGSEPKKQSSIAAKTGKEWVLAQPKSHYTLQLAIFSTRRAAESFSREKNLQGGVTIAPLIKDSQTQYVVLKGSFKSRQAADKQKQRDKMLKPWVRQFADIRQLLK